MQIGFRSCMNATSIAMTIQSTMIISIMLLKELILYYQEQMERLF